MLGTEHFETCMRSISFAGNLSLTNLGGGLAVLS